MNNANTQKITDSKTNDKNVEVLYQKMGNHWFAFSVVGDEVFMGSITQEEIDALEKREAKDIYGILGTS